MDKVKIDHTRNTFSYRLIPDPRRYEWVTKDGIKYLYDKLDNLMYGPEVLDSMAKQMTGRPVYFQPRFIENLADYLESRIPIIEAGLNGKAAEVDLSDPSAEFLASLAKSKQGFAIMCVDVAGSTFLAHSVNEDNYAIIISTLLSEMSQVVFGYRGHILKYTGDGIIAYFPEPSLITMNDLSFDCACALKILIKKIFNPLCMKKALPSIDIRIGIDSGQANIIVIGSPMTKRQKDIIGRVVNIAAKIQALGSPGDILVGEAARRLVHTMWREGLEESELPDNWKYKTEGGMPYRVFKLRDGFTPRLDAT